MSLLSRSELTVFLYPERIALLRAERRLTVRGYSRAVRARRIIQCESAADEEKPWRAAVDALEAALPEFGRPSALATVVLSDKFMHYALIPWLDNLSDEEDLALAQHRFGAICGAVAESLVIRISPGPSGVASLAGAVDGGLLQDLTTLMGRMNIRIQSIQPHLMVAYNSCRAILGGRSAWVVLLEPNSLCLTALREGQLVWIRKLRIGDAWREEFPDILERETYLAEAAAQTDEVMLWAPHLAADDMPRPGRWRIQRMGPTPPIEGKARAMVPPIAAEKGA